MFLLSYVVIIIVLPTYIRISKILQASKEYNINTIIKVKINYEITVRIMIKFRLFFYFYQKLFIFKIGILLDIL